MKSKQLIIFIAFIVVTLGTVNIVKSHIREQNNNETTGGRGVAVVELFTSEGCSSCPSADALLSKLKSENVNNVFLLAFHVDYWNYLGWKDRFSDAAYSQRQQNYSDLLHGDVYTPQMVVNGSTQFVGSNETTARSSINKSLDEQCALSISLQPKYNNADRSINVSYTLQGNLNNEILNVALVQKNAQSDPSKGENSGHHLSHVNVVRDFKTIVLNNNDGTIKLILPSDVLVDNVLVIAYTQLASSLKVTGATATSPAVN